MVLLFRTLYIIGPIFLFVCYFFYQDTTSTVLHSINSVQGEDGWIKVNQGRTETVGNSIEEFLFIFINENDSPSLKDIIEEIGFQTDRLITIIEYNWAWIGITFLFLGGLYICLGVKTYD